MMQLYKNNELIKEGMPTLISKWLREHTSLKESTIISEIAYCLIVETIEIKDKNDVYKLIYK